MQQLPGSEIRLLFMFSLTLLLLLQFGIALLHHHHQGSYCDHSDQFHHVTIEAPCPGKVTRQSKLPVIFTAVIPPTVNICSPTIIVSMHCILVVRSLMKSCERSSSHDRAPPV